MHPSFLKRDKTTTIAYHLSERTDGGETSVVFLGGFRSDMTGTKAQALENWCREQGRGFLRFDYTGHGASSGDFADGCISQWANDAIYTINELMPGPLVLVGSSMGGWLMALAAEKIGPRVRGLVGLAAAPDFTEDIMERGLDATNRETLMRDGRVELPNDYDPADPYIITRKLIEDGRGNLLLEKNINFSGPVRLIQGMRDTDVPWQTALELQKSLASDDVVVQLVKNGDHRLSEPDDLKRICATLGRMLEKIEGEK